MPSNPRQGPRAITGTTLQRVLALAIAIAAAVVTALSFAEGRGEGIRSLLFFLIPAGWGLFVYLVLEGQPAALERGAKIAMPASGVIAGLVISSVLLLDAPVSIANLALGGMEAFLFLMALGMTTRRGPPIPWPVAMWPLSVLLMVTIISIAVAVTV